MDISIKKLHNEKTLTGFLYAAFGVTLPLIVSLVGIIIIRKYEFIISFLDNGQLLLFSAALFTNSIFIYRDEENQSHLTGSNMKYDRLLSHVNVFFLVITSVSYALIYSIQISHNIDINYWFIRGLSVFLFSLSLIIAYRSIRIDFCKFYPNVDVRTESAKEVDDLMGKI